MCEGRGRGERLRILTGSMVSLESDTGLDLMTEIMT